MSESELNYSCDSDSDVMDSVRKRQLLNQIAELQYAVTDMKSAFTAAVQQLSRVQVDDQGGLAEKVEQNKAESQNQVSEVLKLMLSMRAEFASLKHQVSSSCEAQQNLQRQVQTLVWERDLLVEELCKSGSISDQIRYRIQNPRQLGRASSGSHSNDSGVVLVVDKGPDAASFENNVVGSFLVSAEHRDAVSIPYQPPNLISPLVHDYVAGLEQDRSDFIGNEISTHAYDSDSSLVNAANKSISLSTSLGKQCGLQLDSCDVGSDDDHDVEADSNSRQINRVIEPSNPDVTSCDVQPFVAVDAAAVDDDDDHEGLNVENTRRLVLTEIVDTERRYCKSLSTLHDTFAVPLKRSGILSSKDINTLFPDEVFQLYGRHCILLHNLEERFRCWGHHKTVGDVFNNFTDPNDSNVLQLYTSYVDDFPEVLKTFHKLCRHSTKFARFLKSRLSQPACGGLDLGVFLVTPVQRIPHYVLLLKRMLRLTNEKHPDHEWLNDCLERLKDFMDRLNDTMEHSFQLITAQIQPEDEPKPRPQRNVKTRSRQDLCANSNSQDEQTNFSLPPKRVASKELMNTKDSTSSNVQDSCQRNQQQQPQQQEKHFRRLSQSNVRSLLPCGNNKLRTRSRSESLVSSISTNSEEQDGDWNSGHHHHQHQQQQQPQQRFYRKTESYYWHDDVEFHCESGPNSISTEEDSNNAGGASILLRHISEDSDTDEENASEENVRSSKSMLDVKRDECSSEPNLVDANGGQHVPKCCKHSAAVTGGLIGRGVSLACISPTDKRIRAKLMMQPAGRRPLDKSQSAHNLVKEHACDCSIDSSSSSAVSSSSKMKESNKKRNFIRTSLKNILLFKKRNELKKSASSEVVSQLPSRTIVEEKLMSSSPPPSSPNDGVHETNLQQGCCCCRPSSSNRQNPEGHCTAVAAASCHCRCGNVHTCSTV